MIVWWLINVNSNTLGAFSRERSLSTDQCDIMAAGWYHSAEDSSDEGSEENRIAQMRVVKSTG